MLISIQAKKSDYALIFSPGFLADQNEFEKIINQVNISCTVYILNWWKDYLAQPFSYQLLVNKIDSELQGLPEKNLLIVGYSLGARLAFGCYLASPSKYTALFLESFNPGIPNLLEREERIVKDRELATQIRNEGLENFLKGWYQNPIFFLNAKEQQKILNTKKNLNPELCAKILEELSVGKMPSYWDNLSLVSCPVRLVSGAKDIKFTNLAIEINEKFPNSELTIIPEAGHNVHYQKPKEYLQVLNKFLTSHLR